MKSKNLICVIGSFLSGCAACYLCYLVGRSADPRNLIGIIPAFILVQVCMMLAQESVERLATTPLISEPDSAKKDE